MLVFTVAGLAISGVFAFLDFEVGVDVALVTVAVVPLIPLIREMWRKLRNRQAGVDIIALLGAGTG